MHANSMPWIYLYLSYTIECEKKAIYPNPQDDLARLSGKSVQKADEYHVDMTDYSVWGASAGGHLAGSFGTTVMGYARYQLPKPGAIVLSYPVITLEKDRRIRGTRQNHIGKKQTRKQQENIVCRPMLMLLIHRRIFGVVMQMVQFHQRIQR